MESQTNNMTQAELQNRVNSMYQNATYEEDLEIVERYKQMKRRQQLGQEYDEELEAKRELLARSAIINPRDIDQSYDDSQQNKHNLTMSTRVSLQQQAPQRGRNLVQPRPHNSEPSTMNHTPNTSNFTYQTKYNNSDNIQNILQDLDFSRIDAVPRQYIGQSEITQIIQDGIRFAKSFERLGIKLTHDNILRARKSQQSLRSWSKLFVENKENGLFKLDFVSKNGISINKGFFQKLKEKDLFLLNRIEIGNFIQVQKIKDLLNVDFESLRQLSIQRQWDEDFIVEHGFEFLKDTHNQKRLVTIEWKADKLTEKFVESFEGLQFKALKQLVLDFSENVQNEKAYGKMLMNLFQEVDNQNESQEYFKIILCSSIKDVNKLGPAARSHEERIQLRPKGTTQPNLLSTEQSSQNNSQQVVRQNGTVYDNVKICSEGNAKMESVEAGNMEVIYQKSASGSIQQFNNSVTNSQVKAKDNATMGPVNFGNTKYVIR